jgi:monothiol glutaredoxin
MSYSDQIKDVIERSDVVLFMKGTPQLVMCGNSDRALRALRRAGAPVTAVDILRDARIRQDLSALSGWPTIPQVFVKGELIGGADIVEELERTGELETTLVEKLGEPHGADRGACRLELLRLPARRARRRRASPASRCPAPS